MSLDHRDVPAPDECVIVKEHRIREDASDCPLENFTAEQREHNVSIQNSRETRNR